MPSTGTSTFRMNGFFAMAAEFPFILVDFMDSSVSPSVVLPLTVAPPSPTGLLFVENPIGVSIPEIDMDVDCDARGEKIGDATVPPKALLLLFLLPMTSPTSVPRALANEAPPPTVMSTLSGVAAEDAFKAMELSSKLIAVLES